MISTVFYDLAKLYFCFQAILKVFITFVDVDADITQSLDVLLTIKDSSISLANDTEKMINFTRKTQRQANQAYKESNELFQKSVLQLKVFIYGGLL